MAQGLAHRVDTDGILRIVFDTPGERVNLLNAEILDELGRVLDGAREREEVQGVLFSSAKPAMFIAGMDVEQIASVTEAYRGAEGARFGQAVFQRIADLRKPSACAIGGPCMGGGTELALACSFRVASDAPAVKIGLPEVQIGIIPGFGGTQRLPRLVGLTTALDMILTGKRLDARRALEVRLIDRVVPDEYLERETLKLLRRALAEGTENVVRAVRRRRPWSSILLESIPQLRRFVIAQARKKTAAKVRPNDYPAPFRVLEAIEGAFAEPLPQGLDLEARIIGEMIPTPTSKNLIWLFKSHTALKGGSAGHGAVPRKVRKIGVLGAGIMGGGIAQLAADRGVSVRLKDLRYDAILTALSTADKVWRYKVKRKRMTRSELARKMAFIAPTLDDSGLRQVDLVIEAVVEDLEVKRKVLASAEQRIGERTVFASNTSSLPIDDIAARALHPERVIGLHFFNPVHRMPLVEVIAGKLSSPEAVATTHAFAIKLGKTPVIVRDGPGFLVNRILTFYLNEALRLLTEGVRMEAMDSAMIAFGMPMGPFALMDQVGLDTSRHVGEVLQAAFGERVHGAGSVLETMVGDQRLGQKSSRGFYRYRDGKRTVPDPSVYQMIGTPPARELPPETLQERMVLSMVNEAAICLDERVVRDALNIDMAMVMGTGFPPFRGGLLRYADAVGVPIVADRLARLADAHGARFRPADLLGRMVREQRRFHGDR